METERKQDEAGRREVPKTMIDVQRLAEMSLESLLYYVLAGEGRRRTEPVEG